MWNYRKLDVWKRALNLTKVIYEITRDFPNEEKYGLSGQLRRASVSVSSNIAEGCGRRTSKDYIQFLHNAMGSVKEVESELFLAEKLGYIKMIDIEKIFKELDEICNMIGGVIRHVSGMEIV